MKIYKTPDYMLSAVAISLLPGTFPGTGGLISQSLLPGRLARPNKLGSNPKFRKDR
jgi:hypothetical protein